MDSRVFNNQTSPLCEQAGGEHMYRAPAGPGSNSPPLNLVCLLNLLHGPDITSHEELSAGSQMRKVKRFSTLLSAKRSMAQPGPLLVM